MCVNLKNLGQIENLDVLKCSVENQCLYSSLGCCGDEIRSTDSPKVFKFKLVPPKGKKKTNECNYASGGIVVDFEESPASKAQNLSCQMEQRTRPRTKFRSERREVASFNAERAQSRLHASSVWKRLCART